MKNPFDRPAGSAPPRPLVVAVAVAALAILLLLSYLAAVAPRGVPKFNYYELDAEFADTADLRLLSAVHIDGRRAGQVATIDHDGDKVVLRLQFAPGEKPLRSDTRARVRLKNPVGAKYIDLEPGRRGKMLPDRGRLPLRQTSTTVDMAELLEAFDAPTRADVRATVQGLGKGYFGRGQDINRLIGTAPELLDDTRSISDAVLDRDGAARRFFPSAEQLARAYDPVREDLARGFDPQARVLRAFADEADAVRSTLEEAPPALSALRSGLDASNAVLDETAALARATTRFTSEAPAALRETTALLREGGPSLRRSRPLLTAIGDSVRPTIAGLDRLEPLVDPTIRLARNQERPLLEFGVRDCDILLFGRVWRNALALGIPGNTDPTSELDNLQAGLGPNINSYRVLGVPQDDGESLAADTAGTTQSANIGRNPYPKPCEAARERLP
jgi:virulence factor Mce-like protein